MGTESPKARTEKLTVALEEIKRQLSDHPLPPDGLEDVRSAVDHVRSTVWILLTAEKFPREYDVVIAQARLTRVTELCKQVVLDINAGYIPLDSPKFGQLHTALKDVLASIERSML